MSQTRFKGRLTPEWKALNEKQMEIARKLQVPKGIEKIKPINKIKKAP